MDITDITGDLSHSLGYRKTISRAVSLQFVGSYFGNVKWTSFMKREQNGNCKQSETYTSFRIHPTMCSACANVLINITVTV